MSIPRWLGISVGIPAGILLLIILTIFFVPDKELEGIVARGLEREGYTFRAAGFGKMFPLGIEARNLEIGSDRGVVLKADEAAARLRLLPLLTGKVKITFRARIGAGSVTGDFSPQKGGETHLEISGVRLEDIPFFPAVTGARVKGELRVSAAFKGKQNNAGGELQLEVKGAELAGVKIGEMPLPDASYTAVRGMLRVAGGKANLESLTLQGDGLYVRLKGDFPLTAPLTAAPLNLTLELMPKPEFLERQKFVFLLLTKYLTTPGHYQIPIRGMLGKPLIQ